MWYRGGQIFSRVPVTEVELRSVLGIDAAWTVKNPSGVALAIETDVGWKLVCVESSYSRFQTVSTGVSVVTVPQSSHVIDVKAALHACKLRHGVRVDLVAVDMPLSNRPIIGRRAADNDISAEYSSRWAATHSPSIDRPGRLSDDMTAAFARAGYLLQTERIDVPALIEVYPHPALIELTGAEKRLPYKHSKCRTYWEEASADERRSNLMQQWQIIVCYLERKMAGVQELLPLPSDSAKSRELKSYEDKLDAVVCAWVGICALTGRAKPFGNADAAIWVPV